MRENINLPPKFLKLQKYGIPNERYAILMGVGLHFASLAREIDLSMSHQTFMRDLKLFLESKLEHYLNCVYQTPSAIADAFGLNIHFWSFKQDLRITPPSKSPELIRKVHSKFNSYGSIHFGMENDRISYFIFDPAAYGLNCTLTVNYKQAISSHCEISIEEVVAKLPENTLKLRDEVKIHRLFGVGVEIWGKVHKTSTKGVAGFVDVVIFKSRFKNHIKLMVDHWPEDKREITIDEQFQLTNKNLYQCPKNYCLFATSDRWRFDRHVEDCSDETKVDFEQRNLLDDDIVDWMIQEKFLSEIPKIEPKHAHYDLETMLKPNFSSTSKTTCLGEERIISIAVSDNINGLRSKVFARKHLDEDSLDEMVEQFWQHLLDLREEYRQSLPTEVNKAFFKIDQMLFTSELDCFGKKIELPLSDPLKCKLRSAHRYLDQLRSFKVAGWNSENFVMGF